MIRVGVVGVGAIGQEHLGVYRRLPGVEVTAVADSSLELAESSAAAYTDGARVFASATELAESGTVDAISLCTPDHLHHGDALAILSKGIHLLLEKPISTDADEAESLVRAAAQADVVAMPGHTLRFVDRYIAAKNVVSSGRIGEVVHGYARRNNKSSVAERVKGRTNVGFFLGIHDIDAITWIAGQPVEAVQAVATKHRAPGGDQARAIAANLVLASGAVVQIESAWDLPDDYPTDIDARLRLVGDHGEVSIDIHDHGMHVFDGAMRYPVPGALDEHEITLGPLHHELGAFLRCIETGADLPMTMREGADAVHVVLAIEKALTSGALERVARPGA